MTIKQIYVLSAVLLCTLVCSFRCHASESSESTNYIDSLKAELLHNTPELAQPENGPVLEFISTVHFGIHEPEKVKNIFDQTIALNTDNLALMKRLPQIVFEALINHQDQNNRLHRKQIESEDNLNSYNNTLVVFEDCLEILKKIDTCIPNLFLATDLTAIEQLLKKFRQTQYEYYHWCFDRKKAHRPISGEISGKILEKTAEAIFWLIPLPLPIPRH